MKALLHICCGPCAIYPAQVLKEEGFDVEGFFYNPNIHPFGEYKKRYEAVIAVAERLGLDVIHHRYDFEEFLKRVSSIADRAEQHRLCWRMRLEETAKVAQEKGISNFTTTLLSSPYQNIEEIKALGDEIAKQAGLNFLARDFRKGFSESHRISKEWQLYHQNYCGCLYSEKESIEQREKKSKEKAGAGTKRILVIDDEETTRDALTNILRRAGFDASSAGDGPESLLEIRKSAFELVLLDIDLPGMRSLEVFRILKKISPETRICLMTGWPKGVEAYAEDYLVLLEEGAIDKMLRKPLSKDDVLRAILEILQK